MMDRTHDEPWKVGDLAEYKGRVYRIAAMDAFGFCLLKDGEEIAFIHADSRDFVDHLLSEVHRVFVLGQRAKRKFRE